MFRYRHWWPIVRRLPPEFAHTLGLNLLRLPVRFAPPPPNDPYSWGGLTFRNRIGIAAGFDKNAICLRGIERLGAGFVEVGTILLSPWKGNRVSPRMKRLIGQRAIWNRLGFTSRGLAVAANNLCGYPRERRSGMIVAANIGPHPGHLKAADSPDAVLKLALNEFLQLINALFLEVDLFVINLSSPNTPGLRSMLQSSNLTEAVVLPVRRRIRELDQHSNRSWPTPLLVKLPPEDENRELWTDDSLRTVTAPLLQADACDGFVAVNTSTRLAIQHVQYPPPELPGGLSGEPLRAEALRVVAMLRRLIGPQKLLIGCGGVMGPQHAVEFRQAGADLVELYSGMIFAGPSLPAQCAAAIAGMRSAACER
jgi:dihydroorotate dehydrogenase